MKKMFIFIALIGGIFIVKAQTTKGSINTDSREKIYRASYPKTNELIHTKLEVKFDFNKAWMYGKVWVTLNRIFILPTL